MSVQEFHLTLLNIYQNKAFRELYISSKDASKKLNLDSQEQKALSKINLSQLVNFCHILENKRKRIIFKMIPILVFNLKEIDKLFSLFYMIYPKTTYESFNEHTIKFLKFLRYQDICQKDSLIEELILFYLCIVNAKINSGRMLPIKSSISVLQKNNTIIKFNKQFIIEKFKMDLNSIKLSTEIKIHKEYKYWIFHPTDNLHYEEISRDLKNLLEKTNKRKMTTFEVKNLVYTLSKKKQSNILESLLKQNILLILEDIDSREKNNESTFK